MLTTFKRGRLLMAAVMVTFVSAHMELMEPACLGSKFSGGPTHGTDSMRSPLAQDGSMYPCRGPDFLQPNLLIKQATWTAGQSVTLKFDGTTPHFGGSCQYALSYDKGQTFNVFYSEMGGCMYAGDGTTTTPKNEFTVPLPKEVPNGQGVLFGWYWQSKNAGSAEAYHACSVVDIVGGSDQILDEKKFPPPWTGYMEMNGCTYENGNEVVYPNPGEYFVFGGTLKGTQPKLGLNTRPENGAGCIHKGGGMKSLPAAGSGAVGGGAATPANGGAPSPGGSSTVGVNTGGMGDVTGGQAGGPTGGGAGGTSPGGQAGGGQQGTNGAGSGAVPSQGVNAAASSGASSVDGAAPASTAAGSTPVTPPSPPGGPAADPANAVIPVAPATPASPPGGTAPGAGSSGTR